jgi:NAD(P)H:quinone oxidoreductase type IV
VQHKTVKLSLYFIKHNVLGLETKGVHVELFQVAETLSDDILKKMQAPVKPDLPILTVDRMAEPDGIIFGLPTRFGTMPAQMKALLDASGALWAKGALAGKFAGTFFSTASQHGGQESTALSAVTYFSHHGMMYVPFGFANVALYNNDEVVGGSAYGSGTVADGDGSRLPTELELGIAKNQGENFGILVDTFVRGRNAITTADISNKSAAVEEKGTDATAVGTDQTTAGTDPTATTTPTTGAATGVGAAGAGAAVAGAGAGAGAAALAASRSKDNTVGNAAPMNASTGLSDVPAGNAATDVPAKTTAAATTDNVAPTNEAPITGNAAPANATSGIPETTAGNDAINTATTGNATATGLNAADTVAPATAGATTAGGTGVTAADTTGANDNEKNANLAAADENPSKVGATAGTTAATGASAVPNKLKDNKPKKKKWFCCG